MIRMTGLKSRKIILFASLPTYPELEAGRLGRGLHDLLRISTVAPTTTMAAAPSHRSFTLREYSASSGAAGSPTATNQSGSSFYPI